MFASNTPEWALEVPCPYCKAPKGSRCARPSGHKCYPHQGRIREAQHAGKDPVVEAGAAAAEVALERGEDLSDPDVREEVARKAQEALGINDHRAGEDRRQVLMDL